MARGETEHERAVQLNGRVVRWTRATSLRHDRLLLGAVAACTLLLGFQLVMTLRQPPWIGPVTDWLRTALAWPELLILVAASFWLTRRRRLEAVSWWLFSGATFSSALSPTSRPVHHPLFYPP